MADDRTDDPPGAVVATAPEAEQPDAGDEQRERLRRDVVALRARVAQLGLELQVERERVRHLEARLDSTVDPALGDRPAERDADADPAGPSHPLLDRLRDDGASAARTLLQRLKAIAIWPGDRSPAMPWTRPGAREAIAVMLIVGIAVVARASDLADVPDGFQGDEATAGLLGRQIAAEGWIGPYTTLMAGSPTGFFYLVAAAMAVLGDDVLAIRLVPAAFGVLTVAALYVLIRRNFGIPAAVAGAAFLATAGWHIHFSRMAFPTSSWPFVVVLALLALVEAVRTEDWRWWAAAGTLFGVACHTYNAHLLLLAILTPVVAFLLFGLPALGAGAGLALFAAKASFVTLLIMAALLTWALANRRVQDRRMVASALAFAVPLILVGSVLFRYIAENRTAYFNYGTRISIFNTDEWAAQESRAGQVGFVADRYVEFWDRLCCHPRIDAVDATGVTATVPLPMLLLAAIGAGFAVSGRGRVAAALAAFVVLVMPLAAVATTDFALRRAIVLAPLLAMFAGIGLVASTRWAWTRRPQIRYPAIALVAFLAVLSVYRNLDDYFGTAVESQTAEWVLAVEMVEASRYLDALPDDAYVYFFSDRWPWEHEIRRFFAPDAAGEDRGEIFGTYDLHAQPSQGRAVFLFLDAYRDDLAAVQARYPGGETVVAGDPADPDYVVYLPRRAPLEPPPGNGLPAATPAATPAGRG